MKYILYFLVFCAVISCDRKKDNNISISGKAGELLVVMDKQFQDSECGKLLLSYLQQTYPQLPQDEPLFDVTLINSGSLNSFIKTHRSILYCKIGNTADISGIKTNSDVWASPQIYMEITAPDSVSFLRLIQKKYQTIIDFFTQGERQRLVNNYRNYSDKLICESITKKYKVRLAIPKGYKLVADRPDFTWITNETQHASQGILIYELPCENMQKMDVQVFLTLHDSVLKVNVPASLPGSWMTTEREIPVTTDTALISGRALMEIRGLWRTENDFMGGPFIINLFYIPESKSTLVIMGYVYAPRSDKLTYLQQVEAILYSLEKG